MLVTFDTITASLLFQAACKEQRIPCALRTVPRALSTSCGYAAEVGLDTPEALPGPYARVYRVCGNAYEVLSGGEVRGG